MLRLLRTSLQTGRVTTTYPRSDVGEAFGRGVPAVDPDRCRGFGDCARVCPSGAIGAREDAGLWRWEVDLGRCLFCGLCAEVCSRGAIALGHEFELATKRREDLLRRHEIKLPERAAPPEPAVASTGEAEGEPSSKPDARVIPEREALGESIRRRLNRSLHVRHMAAGSENACDWEIAALLGPVYDVQRLGIDFVASPRHADLLLVTGAVTRNLEPALLATYEAMPAPRLVVAVGDEACSGGLLQGSYAVAGGVDRCLPVDVYIPGDPPSPRALIHGLLLALDRM